MAEQIVYAVGIMIAGVFACAAYYWLSDRLLNMALPVRGASDRPLTTMPPRAARSP